MSVLKYVFFFLICNASYTAFSQEVDCSNGIDDDGDGYTDCFDRECPCFTPFLCDDKMYQSASNAAGTRFYELSVSNTGVNLTQLYTIPNSYQDINTLAYNANDGFIYFMNTTSPNTIYRMDKNFNIELVYSFSSIASPIWTGDIYGNTYYFASANGQMHSYDIGSGVLSTNLFSLPGSGDFTFTPFGKGYGVASNTGELFEIDVISQTATPTGITSPNLSMIGAFYYSNDGRLLGYGRNPALSNSRQQTFYEFDLVAQTVSIIGTGPSSQGNDGCSCYSGIKLDKEASLSTVNAGDVFSYHFTIFNQTNALQSNFQFSDTLPQGVTWASDPYNTSNGITFTINPSDPTIMDATVLTLPPGESEFTIDVQVGCSFSETRISNQAYLNIDLGPVFDDYITSDNPASIVLLDPTITEVVIAPQVTYPDSNRQELCASDVFPIDIGQYMGSIPNTGAWIPTLQSGNNVYTPGVDPADTFSYVFPYFGQCIDTFVLIVDTISELEAAFSITQTDVFNELLFSADTIESDLELNYGWFVQGNEISSKPTFVQEFTTYNDSLEVCLELTYGEKCTDEICQNVLISYPLVFIPNAFTPEENNQINPLFGAVIYDKDTKPKKYLLEIFDRWSNKVFETADYLDPWDGKSDGVKVSQGVYYYNLEVEFENTEFSVIKQGSVTLVR